MITFVQQLLYTYKYKNNLLKMLIIGLLSSEKEVEELKGICPVVMIIKYRPFTDHYVAVLEVMDDTVVVGDPLSGRERMTYEEFMDKWRGVGIIVSKNEDKI